MDELFNFAELMTMNDSSPLLFMNDSENSAADSNKPSNWTLPTELTTPNQISVIIYSVFFALSLLGNSSVFIILLFTKNKKSQTRINYLITHLAAADLLVTLFNLPLEIGWRSTIAWRGGAFGCKFLQYLRVFTLYLSSNVLIVVSMDRYFAIMHPIRRFAARKWSSKMLIIAWIVAAICAIPQVSPSFISMAIQ
jgi:gonadotropin-releasing hormone receptor